MSMREILNLVLEAHNNGVHLDKFMKDHGIKCTFEGCSEKVVAYKYEIPLGNRCVVVHLGGSDILLDLWMKKNNCWEYMDTMYSWDEFGNAFYSNKYFRN